MTMKRTLTLMVVVATATLAWGGGIAAARSTGTSARPTKTALPSPGGRPLIAASQPTAGLPTLSENWSGYAVTDTAKFNYVHSEYCSARDQVHRGARPVHLELGRIGRVQQ